MDSGRGTLGSRFGYSFGLESVSCPAVSEGPARPGGRPGVSRAGQPGSRSGKPLDKVGGVRSGSVFGCEVGFGKLMSEGYFYYYSISEIVIFEKSS